MSDSSVLPRRCALGRTITRARRTLSPRQVCPDGPRTSSQLPRTRLVLENAHTIPISSYSIAAERAFDASWGGGGSNLIDVAVEVCDIRQLVNATLLLSAGITLSAA